MTPVRTARAIGIAAGAVADLLFADPQRGHPVALFGSAAAWLEQRTYADTRFSGAVHTGLLAGAVAVAAVTAERAGRRDRSGRGTVAVTAAATWVALGGTSLVRTGSGMAELLAAGDVDAARRLLPSLCGRDPSVLTADGLRAHYGADSLADVYVKAMGSPA